MGFDRCIGGVPRVELATSVSFIEDGPRTHSSDLVRPGLGRKFIITRVGGVEPMIGTEFVIQRWCTEQVAGCTYSSGLDRAHRQDGLRRKFIVESMHQASKAWVAS